jgi:hypothetical protein
VSVVPGGLRGATRFVYLSARLIAGRWFWAVPLLPLIWPAFLGLRLEMGWRPENYAPHEAPQIVGLPLGLLAIGLGVRIIAGEIDARTLEIAYTVPGGASRVWLGKLAAAALMLAAAEGLLALAAAVFTAYPAGILYVPLQAAIFFLVLAMALSTMLRSEVAGALVSIPVLLFSLPLAQDEGARLSPFFNTLIPQIADRADPAEILAWNLQNRVGYLLAISALAALAFARAERREAMMRG